MLATIETDWQSPFADVEVPPAEWTWRHVLNDACRRGPAYLRAWCAKANTTTIPDFPTWPSGCVVEAFVNHGRWLWKCNRCNEAQVASEHDRRAFCCGCFNHGAGYHEVVWPADNVRHQIETLLLRRPLANRNWFPNETIDQLQVENIALGLSSSAPLLPASRYEIAIPLVAQALTARNRKEIT
jgi:hypothetical protein